MANNIALISKHLTLLDQKYQVEAKSSVLDLDGSLVRETMDANQYILGTGGLHFIRNGNTVGSLSIYSASGPLYANESVLSVDRVRVKDILPLAGGSISWVSSTNLPSGFSMVLARAG